MKNEEVLVTRYDFEIETEENYKFKTALESELDQFVTLKPNTNTWYGVPREYYYFKKLEKGDSLEIEQLKDSKVAEKPAILDKDEVERITNDLQQYIRNKKGFYEAEVDHEIKISGKTASVVYEVQLGPPYRIRELEYVSLDTTLESTLQQVAKNSLLKTEDQLDALTFDLEKQRIVNAFQDRGYANFNLSHVEIEGDSTNQKHKVDVLFKVLVPNKEEAHTRYRVGEINVFTDYHQFQKTDSLNHEYLFGKKYYKQLDRFLVKPNVIDKKIFLKTNSYYSNQAYYKTVRKLFSLDTYRFAKLSPTVSTVSDSIIDYNIFLTPQRDRWIIGLNNDVFYSNINSVYRNLVGLTLGTSLENRNTFRGSEIFKIGLESGIEFTLTPDANNRRLVTTFTFGVNSSLQLPRMSKTLNTIPLLNKLNLISDKALSKLNEEGSTEFSAGYNYIDVLDYYQIRSFNASYGYDFTLDNKNRIVVNQMGINLSLNTKLDSFETLSLRNPLLEQSFQSAFFTGFLFNDITYYRQSNRPANKINWLYIFYFELSGLELFLANQAYNAVTNKDNVWKIRNTDIAKFAKLDIDLRWRKDLKTGGQLAWRFRSGVAVPYGNGSIVSWLKQFSVGGPNSIRAWRPMEIGPGAFFTRNQGRSQIFAERGDIITEFSLEYRQKLFWLVEGGLFIDGGNIWTLKEEQARPGSQFTGDFFRQFALGYGYGIRFDFTYFKIRFDFGFQLKNPVRHPDTGELWIPLKGQRWFGNPNVAVNYPF